jgi:hypothetical protein
MDQQRKNRILEKLAYEAGGDLPWYSRLGIGSKNQARQEANLEEAQKKFPNLKLAPSEPKSLGLFERMARPATGASDKPGAADRRAGMDQIQSEGAYRQVTRNPL